MSTHTLGPRSSRAPVIAPGNTPDTVPDAVPDDVPDASQEVGADPAAGRATGSGRGPAAGSGAGPTTGPGAGPSWRRALLLNASREPLCLVGVHRAVTLVLRGKAVVLETDGTLLRSERMTLPAPQVLCLTRYVHVPYRGVVPPTRRTVLQRDAYRCAYCAGTADTVDHVHPRSRGGRHEWTNVVAACTRCNHRKADRLLAEIGWQLLTTPAAPRGNGALLTASVRPHPSWAAYLGR